MIRIGILEVHYTVLIRGLSGKGVGEYSGFCTMRG